MFFIVTVENSYSSEALTVEQLQAKGFKVAPARRSGAYNVYSQSGSMLGWLFASQAEQIAFLQSRGVI